MLFRSEEDIFEDLIEQLSRKVHIAQLEQAPRRTGLSRYFRLAGWDGAELDDDLGAPSLVPAATEIAGGL